MLVLGTGTYVISLEVFLGSMASEDLGYRSNRRHHVSTLKCRGFAYAQVFALKPESNNWLFLAFSVTPSLTSAVQEYQPVVHRLRFSASP